jgi:hypothetical protein
LFSVDSSSPWKRKTEELCFQLIPLLLGREKEKNFVSSWFFFSLEEKTEELCFGSSSPWKSKTEELCFQLVPLLLGRENRRTLFPVGSSSPWKRKQKNFVSS